MRKFRPVLVFVLQLCFIVAGITQSLDIHRRYALAAYHSGNYTTALLYSKKLLENDSTDAIAAFIAGQSCKSMEKYESAEFYFEKIPDSAKSGYISSTDFELAMVKQYLEKIPEAIHLLNKYLTYHRHPGDYLTLRAEEELKRLESLLPVAASIPAGSPSLLGININTSELEIAPLRYADKIWFTRAWKKDKNSPPVDRIFEAVRNYPARLSSINPRDEKLSAADVALMPDASRIYYTLCEKNEKSGITECEIWFRDREYEGNWSNPRKMPPPVNIRNSNSIQPSIGWDKYLKKYVLFFSSDRQGGKGKYDIWAAVLERDGSVLDLFQLPFNTSGNEITPFFHQPSQTLFFSSDSLSGFGNQDIYRTARMISGEWCTPTNLGAQINTPFDELYYTFHTSSAKAFFTSNRPASSQNEPNHNLYEVSITIFLKITVLDSVENSPLEEVTAKVDHLSEGKTTVKSSSPGKTDLLIPLSAGKRHKITLSAPAYQPFSFDFDTLQLCYPFEESKTVLLKKSDHP